MGMWKAGEKSMRIQHNKSRKGNTSKNLSFSLWFLTTGISFILMELFHNTIAKCHPRPSKSGTVLVGHGHGSFLTVPPVILKHTSAAELFLQCNPHLPRPHHSVFTKPQQQQQPKSQGPPWIITGSHSRIIVGPKCTAQGQTTLLPSLRSWLAEPHECGT